MQWQINGDNNKQTRGADKMKTKKAMLNYICFLCKKTIKKGSQYARKTVTLGNVTHWAIDDRPKEEIPDWAWEPYRSAEPVCNACANPK